MNDFMEVYASHALFRKILKHIAAQLGVELIVYGGFRVHELDAVFFAVDTFDRHKELIPAVDRLQKLGVIQIRGVVNVPGVRVNEVIAGLTGCLPTADDIFNS